MGVGIEITLGMLPVIVNTKKMSLVAGPVAGIKYVYLPDLTTGLDFYTFTAPSFSFCYGVKSIFYLGNDVCFSAEFSRFATSMAVVSTPSGANINTPMNLNVLRIGVAYRFSGWWW